MKDRSAGTSRLLKRPPACLLPVLFLLCFAFILLCFAFIAPATAGPVPHDPSLAAIGVFNEALEKNPDDLVALRSRGSTLRALELYDDALIDFERAEKLAPGDAETMIEMGICHYMLGDGEKGLEFLVVAEPLFQAKQEEGEWDFESAAEVEKDMRTTLFRIYREQRAFEKALEQWERLRKYQSRSLGFRCDRADILIELGRLEEALGHYEAAFEWNPLFERFGVGLANCYLLTGAPEKAVALFDRWAEEDSEGPLPRMFRSVVLRDHLGDRDGAAAAIAEALTLARAKGETGEDGELPDFEDLITLARVLQVAGEYEESARHLDEFMEYGRGHYLVVHLQAGNYRALGRTAEADSLDAEGALYRRLNPLDWLQAYDILTPDEACAIPGSVQAVAAAEAAAAASHAGEDDQDRSGAGEKSTGVSNVTIAILTGCVVFGGIFVIALLRRRKGAKL